MFKLGHLLIRILSIYILINAVGYATSMWAYSLLNDDLTTNLSAWFPYVITQLLFAIGLWGFAPFLSKLAQARKLPIDEDNIPAPLNVDFWTGIFLVGLFVLLVNISELVDAVPWFLDIVADPQRKFMDYDLQYRADEYAPILMESVIAIIIMVSASMRIHFEKTEYS